MKIFYAVQATGNGHISRAMELIPLLQRYGTVDVFLSGDNSHLSFDLPVKYLSKGLSLYYNSTGGLDYWKMIRNLNPLRIHKEINDLPVEKYDLVINDFEYITAAACAKKKIPSVQFGHQASFQSRLVPRPDHKNPFGEWILKNYSKATDYVGLHFERYDDFIFYPVIKKEIVNAAPADKNYVTVYLSSYSLSQLKKIFTPFKDLRFQVFSKEIVKPEQYDNLHFFPVNSFFFNESLINCTGIITGAGFETPAEALYLGKKVLAIPTKGQYEQQCNAAALQRIGVVCPKKIDASFSSLLYQWLDAKTANCYPHNQSISQVINYLFSLHENRRNVFDKEALAIA